MPYADTLPSDSSSAANAAAVTPHNTNDLANTTRALWIGGAGAITVNMLGTGDSILISAIPAGTLLPIRVTRVFAAGTDATLIVALW